MFYRELIDELAARLKIDKGIPDNRIVLGRKINLTYDEVANAFDWEVLKRNSELITTPNYTAGTVTITKDSRTITGSGTTWTLSMEGSYINFQGSSNWYRIIKFVSATSLTTLLPVIEDSASGQTYKIWKRFTYFPPEVRKILNFSTWFRSGQMSGIEQEYIRDNYADISNTGSPEVFDINGADPFERSYADGTVAVTKDSNLATGATTLFLANAEPGDILTIGSFEFRVKRVESDTTIRLYNFSTVTISASSYTLTKDNPLGVQLMFQPDKKYVLPYDYVKRVFPMIHEDKDRPELPKEFDQAILDGAEASKMRDMDDQKWGLKMQEYQARVKFLKSVKLNPSIKRISQLRPYIPTRGGY